jgi:hypothetical protein
MGRSVSYANGSEVVIYAHIEAVYDDEDNYDEFESQYAWDCAIENLVDSSLEAFPSLNKCDEWLGREDHAILESNLVYVGISEYCGLVSVWVVPKDKDSDKNYFSFGVRSANIMKAKLEQIVQESFGVRLNKVGQFSNGEAVFNKAA